MKQIISLTFVLIMLMGCAAPATQQAPADQAQNESVPVSTNTPLLNMPNPASVYCEQQGYQVEIHTAPDGNQAGYCIFPDGSECDEWAFFRGECVPASQTLSPTEIPTAMPIDPADYQGWWTYTHAFYNFSIMLPEDWVVEEVTTNDLLMNHALNLHPKEIAPDVKAGYENIRMTFRRTGEDAWLWPTGVGEGEFILQGTLDIANQPARRLLLVCPTGEITAIWYHGEAEDQPNVTRGEMEFGFIFSAGSHCESGLSLSGKVQRWGEMIIASLIVP